MLDIPKAQEEFEDIKEVIRICKSTVSTMAKRKRTKRQKDKQRSLTLLIIIRLQTEFIMK
jgi:hypothetical protein